MMLLALFRPSRHIRNVLHLLLGRDIFQVIVRGFLDRIQHQIIGTTSDNVSKLMQVRIIIPATYIEIAMLLNHLFHKQLRKAREVGISFCVLFALFSRLWWISVSLYPSLYHLSLSERKPNIF